MSDGASKLAKLEESYQVLKNLCMEQDEQLEQLDVIAEKLEAEKRAKVQLEERIGQLKQDLKSAKAQTNEEKSLKMFNEKQAKVAKDQIDQAEKHHEEQLLKVKNEVKKLTEANVKVCLCARTICSYTPLLYMIIRCFDFPKL